MKHNERRHQQTSLSTLGQINNFEVLKNISMFSEEKLAYSFLSSFIKSECLMVFQSMSIQ